MTLYRQVFALILFGKEKFSDKMIDDILGLPPHRGSVIILSKLQSVVAFEHGKPVDFYHASFHDFLSASERSGEWCIKVSDGNKLLAERCLCVMEDLLHFNMADLQTSFIPNVAVEGLEQRISTAIPPYFQYVCRSWASHLRASPFSTDLLSKLRSFVYNQLLYWFEVLGLTKEFYHVPGQALRMPSHGFR